MVWKWGSIPNEVQGVPRVVGCIAHSFRAARVVGGAGVCVDTDWRLMMNVLMLMRYQGPSPYRRDILREQRVLPGLCGLPRIIRAFVGV